MKLNIFIFVIVCTFILSFGVDVSFSFAAEANVSVINRVFYYREGDNARASLFAHPDSIDILAPQSYSIDRDALLSGEVVQDVIDFAKSKNIKIMPLVTNKGFGQESLNVILNDTSKQDVVFDELVREAKTNGYMGWQIDFEQMDVSLKDKFSDFVKRFHKKMQDNGLVLSVAVIAKISDNPDDYKKDLWKNLIGAYDYDTLASNSDFVSVMSYDDPESKGPVARDVWLKKVLSYSLLHIPKNKISLGIGLYYWLWDDQADKLVGIGGYEGMKNVLEKYRTNFVYSSKNHAAYLTYVKKKKHYTMWYENGKSVKEKIALIKKNGLNGFSAWALGLEVPSVHSVL